MKKSGVLTRLHLAVIDFCIKNNFSCGISKAKASRSSIIPSLALIIKSMLPIASKLSIFDITPIDLLSLSINKFYILLLQCKEDILNYQPMISLYFITLSVVRIPVKIM